MIEFITRKMVAVLVVVGLASSAAAAPPGLPSVWDPIPSQVLPSAPKWPDFSIESGFGLHWTPSVRAAVTGKFDFSKYPEERKALIGTKDFPKLGVEFEVIASSTGHPNVPASLKPGVKPYNCIAWTLGITDRWVWPGSTLPDFDDLYTKYGFERLKSRDTSAEVSAEKVVLYGNLRDDGRVEATHGAKQEADGTWSSKIGGMARIKHPTPEAVAGGSYGDPIAVYSRKKPGVKP